MSQASPFSKLIHFQVVINGVPKSVAMKIERKSSNPNNWPSLVNPPRLKFDCLLEGNTSNKLWAFQRPWKRTSFQRHLGLGTSALAGDPDPYPRVFGR